MNLEELKKANEEEAIAAESNTESENAVSDEVTGETLADDDTNTEGETDELWLSETQDPEVIPVSTHIGVRRKLKGKISEQNDRISELEAEIARMKEVTSANLASPKLDLPARPAIKNFNSDEEYEQALSKYEADLVEVQVSRVLATKNSTTTVETRKKALDTAVDEHYARAETLVKTSGIKPDLYKTADETVRRAVEEVRPNFGDLIVDQLISVLGDGSEKVFYYIGRNAPALETVKTLLVSDPSGMKAAIYLGQQKERLTSKITRRSGAPAPGVKTLGDKGGSGQANALKQKYQKAHEGGKLQLAYNLKKEAKKLKIDVSTW